MALNFQSLLNGESLFGSAPAGGVMGEETRVANKDAMMALASQLLAGSGYSSQRSTFGQQAGLGLQAANAARTQSLQAQQKQRLIDAQIQALGARQVQEPPAGVQEFQYAKAQGFPGSFEDWKRVASAQAQAPAGIQEFEYFNKLAPEQQKQFLSLQRSPVVPQVVNLNGVPTLVDRTGATAPNPLSTQQSEIDAAVKKALAESQAKATGTIQGEVAGGIEKKGMAAKGVNDILDLADPLIDAATGSLIGAGRDKLAAAFGAAPEGAQATAQLQILQASLMMAQPRMEGPQGEKDVLLYQQAAGQLGDPTVPSAIKKAAVKTIRDLQSKYQAASGQGSQKRVKVDANGDVIQ